MTPNTTHSQTISAALVGASAVLIAVIVAASYLILVTTKPIAKTVTPKSYPTQVLTTAFSPNGVFAKTKTLTNPGSSTPIVTAPAQSVSVGEIGKTDITAFE